LRNKDKSAKQLVEEIIQRQRQEDDHQLPNPANEARVVQHCRAAVRPPEPNTLDFEVFFLLATYTVYCHITCFMIQNYICIFQLAYNYSNQKINL
jgi:hypothetical protein